MKKSTKRTYASLPTRQAQSVAAVLERHLAKVVPLVIDMAMHEATHAAHDALTDVNECQRKLVVALAELRKVAEANDPLACGDVLQELEELHNGLAVAAAASASRFAELTSGLRRHILAKLGIEESPAEVSTWVVTSEPKVVATWVKKPTKAKKRPAKKRPAKKGGRR